MADRITMTILIIKT